MFEIVTLILIIIIFVLIIYLKRDFDNILDNSISNAFGKMHELYWPYIQRYIDEHYISKKTLPDVKEIEKLIEKFRNPKTGKITQIKALSYAIAKRIGKEK